MYQWQKRKMLKFNLFSNHRQICEFICMHFMLHRPLNPSTHRSWAELSRAEQSNLSTVSQAHSSTLVATTNIVPLFITVEWIAFGRINKINVQNNTGQVKEKERDREWQTERVLNNPNEHWWKVSDQKMILKSASLQLLLESPYSHHLLHLTSPWPVLYLSSSSSLLCLSSWPPL